MNGQLNGKCVLIPIPPNLLQKLFSRIKNSTSYETVTFASVNAELVRYHKYLGFVLDSKINYSKHHNEKIAKANQSIGVIKLL